MTGVTGTGARPRRTLTDVTVGESEETVLFNPLEPGYVQDPYTQFAALRDHEPVHHTLVGPWAVFRYEDVFALLRDATLSVDDANLRMEESERAAMFEELIAEYGRDERGSRAILNLDPPDHTRLRKLVSKAFTPRTVERLGARVEQLVTDTLDAAADRGEMDVVCDLAFPLPFTVISELLGMPEGDREQIRGWSHAMTKTLDPIITPADARAAFEASDAMSRYLHEAVAWKRDHPADDLLTGLLQAEEDGDRLSADELRDQVVLLFIAGHETTVNLIGNGVLALLRNRDQLERWRDDPSLDASAVDELLRYDSPVQFSRRITLREHRVGGQELEPGVFVFAALASANRDPRHWGDDADELDLGRAHAGTHLAFGSGAHYCLGAALARLEGRLAISGLIRRFPALDLAGEPVYNGRINLRGLEQLPVRF